MSEEAFEDCDNCKHTYGVTCLSPKFKAMPHRDQRIFMNACEVPCPLFEPEDSLLPNEEKENV